MSSIIKILNLVSSGLEEETKFRKNKYWHQVHLDVNRSHRRFPKSKCFVEGSVKIKEIKKCCFFFVMN